MILKKKDAYLKSLNFNSHKVGSNVVHKEFKPQKMISTLAQSKLSCQAW